jgi:hypothetical protein
MRCERAHHEPLPTMAQLDHLIEADGSDQLSLAPKPARSLVTATDA